MAPCKFYVENGNAVLNVSFIMEIKFFTYFHLLTFCAVERKKKSEHENFDASLTTLYLAIEISEMPF